MRKIKISDLIAIGISLLCICVFTLFLAWHLVTAYIREADGWDLNSILQLLQAPLPSDASDVTYNGTRRGHLTWLQLRLTSSFESLNNFAVAVCNQPLQPTFDPSNAIFLSTSYNDLNPVHVLVDNHTVFAYSPPSRLDLSGLQCELQGGYIKMVANNIVDPTLTLEFSSVCFYPCQLNHIDREAIHDAPFVFRGFALASSGKFTIVGNACIELHPQISYIQDTSYIDAQLSILIDGSEIVTAIVSELFQLEPLVDFNVNTPNSQFFDVCFTRTWNAGEHRIDLNIVRRDGNTAYYSFEFIR